MANTSSRSRTKEWGPKLIKGSVVCKTREKMGTSEERRANAPEWILGSWHEDSSATVGGRNMDTRKTHGRQNAVVETFDREEL